MKLGLTVLGVAARLARWRIAHSREEAIRSALRSVSEQRRQQAARDSDRGTNAPITNERDSRERS